MTNDKLETTEPVKKAGRPKLSVEQRAERDKKKETKSGETRDSVRIYFTPLQYAYLKDYHAQGGVLPGEAIRLAVDHYFQWLIDTERYEPSAAASPKAARLAWEARQKVEKEYTALVERETGGDPDMDVSDDYPPPAGLKDKDKIR